MTEDDGPLTIRPESGRKADGVEGRCGSLESTIGWDRRGCIPSQERGHGPVSRRGKPRQEMTPRVGRIWKSMEADDEGSVVVEAGREIADLQVCDPLGSQCKRTHDETLVLAGWPTRLVCDERHLGPLFRSRVAGI